MSEEQAVSIAEAWGKAKSALTSLLNYLNVFGSIMLAYALQNQTIVSEMLPFLPEPWRPFAPLLGGAWFAVVQVAKMNAINKATQA